MEVQVQQQEERRWKMMTNYVRNTRAVGVLCGFFSVCLAIIIVVVIQPRPGQWCGGELPASRQRLQKMSGSFKIDVHNHILPEEWPDLKQQYGYGGWIRMQHCGGKANMYHDDGRFFRACEPNVYSTEARLKDMDDKGVNVQVLSTVPVMFSYWAKPEDTLDFSKFLNNDIYQRVQKHPKRFLGFGTVPMQAPELAAQELVRCVTQLGFVGIQIGSHVNDWNLDAPELDPVWKAAEEHNCVIFVHPWDMQMGGRMSKYWLPWLVGMPAETATAISAMIFGGVFNRFPRLKACFAHGGGSFPFTIGRIEHGYNVRPDLFPEHQDVNPRQYLGRIYTDSLVHDARALKLLVDVIGKDHVMLGTDYPFPLGEIDNPGGLIESMPEFSSELKKKLLGGNACDFLGINKQNYLPI